MTTLHFDLPPSFGSNTRLFPLSDLVMFPSNLLPLHIFESRYREMLEDAMQGDQLISMATLLPGLYQAPRGVQGFVGRQYCYFHGFVLVK